ncbi:MAG TPA: septum formation initiator family protein [Verrucomicrobiae bacterium]
MAGNRKNQTAAVHFSAVLKVVLLCSVIGGSAIGYVWQKNEISRLDKLTVTKEKALEQLRKENKLLADQVAVLRSPVMIDRRAKELNLGLTPAQPVQKVVLAENPSAYSAVPVQPRQYAARPAVERTP